MTQRSIAAGKTPTVIARGGMDVHVEGWDDERVVASTEHKGSLKLERRSEPALGHVRARVKVGDRVFFDRSADLRWGKNKDETEDTIQVRAGGDIVVHVPYGSTVKIYAGRSVEVLNIRGRVTAYAGRDARLRNVHALVHVSAGRSMDLDCETLAGDNKLSAGRDLRFCIRDLNDVTIRVDDLGGYWEAVIGNGHRQIQLEAGGDVTLVADQPVKAQPPERALAHIVVVRNDK